MYIHCPHCGTYAELRGPMESLRCAFCDDLFQPSRLDLLRYRRMQEEARLHERLAPLNFWGTLVIAGITALLLLGMMGSDAPGHPLSTAAVWLFPCWVMLLTLGIWLVQRSKHAAHLPLLSRVSVVLLLVLMLPLIYSGLPRGVRQAAGAPVRALTSIAANR